MKIRKKRWIAAIPLLPGIGYLAINPRQLYALFGMGDIVFGPTSYATLGHIWTEDISTGAKILQTYNHHRTPKRRLAVSADSILAVRVGFEQMRPWRPS